MTDKDCTPKTLITVEILNNRVHYCQLMVRRWERVHVLLQWSTI